MVPIRASIDPALHAQVVARRPLLYSHPRAGHPPHVRAGSSLSWFEGRLAITQDDTLSVALVDVASGDVEAVELPLRADGARSFDVEQGNKKHKADLEASVTASWQGAPALFAFGSGSSKRRESIAIITRAAQGLHSQLIEAHALYARLRAEAGFLTTELNLEGAVLIGTDTLRLFQRSNGSLLAADCQACCATCDLSFAALTTYLGAPRSAPVPNLHNVCLYDLGKLDSARLTFTDAALLSESSLIFSASAESSPNAIDDGAVAGSALGILDARGARLCVLQDEAGVVAPEKAEGLALALESRRRAYVVFDPDDHRLPAALAEVELSGFE